MKNKEINLLKNNDGRDWDDLQWIDEFYMFLQGDMPEGISVRHKPKLNKKQAFSIIWYLQEHFPVLNDHIEQCDTCGRLFDSWSQGYYSDLTLKHYCCDTCEPAGLHEKEEQAIRRKDAPFQKWLKRVKKEQMHYPALKGKEISEPALRGYFHKGLSPIDTLNDILTLV